MMLKKIRLWWLRWELSNAKQRLNHITEDGDEEQVEMDRIELYKNLERDTFSVKQIRKAHIKAAQIQVANLEQKISQLS